FFFSSRRRHTRSKRDWSSDVCSSDLPPCISAIVSSTFREAGTTSFPIPSPGITASFMFFICTLQNFHISTAGNRSIPISIRHQCHDYDICRRCPHARPQEILLRYPSGAAGGDVRHCLHNKQESKKQRNWRSG